MPGNIARGHAVLLLAGIVSHTIAIAHATPEPAVSEAVEAAAEVSKAAEGVGAGAVRPTVHRNAAFAVSVTRNVTYAQGLVCLHAPAYAWNLSACNVTPVKNENDLALSSLGTPISLSHRQRVFVDRSTPVWGTRRNLTLDLYRPVAPPAGAAPAPLPVMLQVHGGSYTHGDDDNAGMVSNAEWFAARGWLGVSTRTLR